MSFHFILSSLTHDVSSSLTHHLNSDKNTVLRSKIRDGSPSPHEEEDDDEEEGQTDQTEDHKKNQGKRRRMSQLMHATCISSQTPSCCSEMRNFNPKSPAKHCTDEKRDDSSFQLKKKAKSTILSCVLETKILALEDQPRHEVSEASESSLPKTSQTDKESSEKKKRPRTAFTSSQIQSLEDEFDRSKDLPSRR